MQDVVLVAVKPETRALVDMIAQKTNAKKYSIYDRAIKDYARKTGVAAAGN